MRERDVGTAGRKQEPHLGCGEKTIHHHTNKTTETKKGGEEGRTGTILRGVLNGGRRKKKRKGGAEGRRGTILRWVLGGGTRKERGGKGRGGKERGKDNKHRGMGAGSCLAHCAQNASWLVWQ